MVIDNDAAILAASTALLRRWSCTVTAARSPAEAIALARVAGGTDVILADYHLDDGRTGLDAIADLRQLAGRPVPAIVVTADHSLEVAAAVREAEAELLHKPVRPAELRALLAHMLG
ncbi:response regulator [Methylobrevis pamukkalensis]|uniref:Two-component response regulator n=1 Tax=Methylobrevis pamukkalensis TaxID=1439726 RepID=A0A1E3H8V3_9HYPH|nr:two-component response regulator [Methylobrevis pamukkalensis]